MIFPVKCRASIGSYEEGKEGLLLAIVDYGQRWAVVIWDGEEDPTTHKAGSLDIEVSQWSKL